MGLRRPQWSPRCLSATRISGQKRWARWERIYSVLGIPAEEGISRKAVEKHSWQNVPEREKGRGKFYRRGRRAVGGMTDPEAGRGRREGDRLAAGEVLPRGLRLPEASVVIPTFEAGPGFDELLKCLFSQRTNFGYEVLVVDSGSTDGTVEIAERYGASVHRIDPAEFDHGATRNLGASLSSGRYVAFLVQDALPVDDGWLAAMVDVPRRRRDGSRGVRAPDPTPRQRPDPRPDARLAHLRQGRREQFTGGPCPYGALSPATRRSLAAFDNVNSCVRRSVWESVPFERTHFGRTSDGARPSSRRATPSSTTRARPYSTPTSAAPSTTSGATTWTRWSCRSSSASHQPRTGTAASDAIRTSAHLYLRRDGTTGAAPQFLLLAVRYALCSQTGAYLAAQKPELKNKLPPNRPFLAQESSNHTMDPGRRNLKPLMFRIIHRCARRTPRQTSRPYPVRILFTAHQFFPEGRPASEIVTLGLARELKACGHEPFILAAKRTNPHSNLLPCETEDYEFEGRPRPQDRPPEEGLTRPYELNYHNDAMAGKTREYVRGSVSTSSTPCTCRGSRRAFCPSSGEFGVPVVFTAAGLLGRCARSST